LNINPIPFVENKKRANRKFITVDSEKIFYRQNKKAPTLSKILNVRAVIVEFTGSSPIRTCLLALCIYLFQLNFRHEKTPETLMVTGVFRSASF